MAARWCAMARVHRGRRARTRWRRLLTAATSTRARRRVRRVPYLALGGLLVVVCVLGFAAATVRLGQRVSVLAIAQPVAAGQRIEAADLTQVSAADDPSLGLIPVSQAASVEGRTAVVPLLP